MISTILYKNDEILLKQLMVTTSPRERMLGLLGEKKLQLDEALLISPCNSVHSLFMSFPIDVVYLDKQQYIVKLVEEMHPWRVSMCLKAFSTIEFASGQIETMALSIGQKLSW